MSSNTQSRKELKNAFLNLKNIDLERVFRNKTSGDFELDSYARAEINATISDVGHIIDNEDLCTEEEIEFLTIILNEYSRN